MMIVISRIEIGRTIIERMIAIMITGETMAIKMITGGTLVKNMSDYSPWHD